MANFIKVSSLTKEDLQSFVKHSDSKYVLARKLHDYPWDSGSIWKLMKDPSSGDLVLAKEIEDAIKEEKKLSSVAHKGLKLSFGAKETDEDQTTAFGKCHCGAPLTSIIVQGSVLNYCKKCNPTYEKEMEQLGVKNNIEEAEAPIATGLPVQASVNEDIFNNKLLPKFSDWIDYEKFRDFSKEGVIKRIKTAVQSGEISNTEGNMMIAYADRLMVFAKSICIAFGSQELFGDENNEGESKPESQFSNGVVGKVLQKKPENMSMDVFSKLYKKLKTASKKS